MLFSFSDTITNPRSFLFCQVLLWFLFQLYLLCLSCLLHSYFSNFISAVIFPHIHTFTYRENWSATTSKIGICLQSKMLNCEVKEFFFCMLDNCEHLEHSKYFFLYLVSIDCTFTFIINIYVCVFINTHMDI